MSMQCDHPCPDYFDFGTCECTDYKCVWNDDFYHLEGWDNDEDDWELEYAWPTMPELEGEDLFSDWPITGTEEM